MHRWVLIICLKLKIDSMMMNRYGGYLFARRWFYWWHYFWTVPNGHLQKMPIICLFYFINYECILKNSFILTEVYQRPITRVPHFWVNILLQLCVASMGEGFKHFFVDMLINFSWNGVFLLQDVTFTPSLVACMKTIAARWQDISLISAFWGKVLRIATSSSVNSSTSACD